tara:strand:+ start:2346 stop:2594 length:249 start_codon:yes stop_codon:yes gene_type:complete
MVKLVNTGDLKSPGLCGLAGSSPARGTTLGITMSIDIHSEIEEAKDTRIRLAAKIEVLEDLLEEINNIKKAAEIVLDGISND